MPPVRLDPLHSQAGRTAISIREATAQITACRLTARAVTAVRLFILDYHRSRRGLERPESDDTLAEAARSYMPSHSQLGLMRSPPRSPHCDRHPDAGQELNDTR